MVRLLHFRLILALMVMTTSSWATTYYIAANGSDSSSGTSMASPWRHANGMQNCTGTCASHTPVAGDRFIFRGGDTWFHTLAGQSEDGSSHAVGLQWQWSASGTASNYIYIGVDSTTPGASGTGTVGWYNPAICGSSWCRPILDGGNTFSTTPVSSCAHPFGQGTRFFNGAGSYFQLDDFDFRGICWNSSGYNPSPTYIAGWTNQTYSNLYLHGWTHTSFSGSAKDGVTGIIGPTGNTIGITTVGLVCDGADSDQTSFDCMYGDGYDIHYSVFRHASNGFVGDCHTVHDNLFEYIYESSDNVTHSNVAECNNEPTGGLSGSNHYVYNNLVRHTYSAVTFWTCPRVNDYYFNNVFYDILSQGWDIADSTAPPCGGGGNGNFYNNTFVSPGVTVGKPGSWKGIFNNNLFIDGASISGTITSQANSISLTAAQATSAGILASNNYQPDTANCNGTSPCPVGSGANLTSICASTPKSSLCSDTTAGVQYDSVMHRAIFPGRTSEVRPTSAAWSVGAYESAVGTQGNLGPPSNLTATVQ
jgi:hypothetical protein